MTEQINDGGPAFAQEQWSPDHEMFMVTGGVSLRDYFAAKCDVAAYGPADAFARKYGRRPIMEELAEYIAGIRYIEADAMLRIRSNG